MCMAAIVHMIEKKISLPPPPLPVGGIWNLHEIYLMISEEKSFKILTDDGQVIFGLGH